MPRKSLVPFDDHVGRVSLAKYSCFRIDLDAQPAPGAAPVELCLSAALVQLRDGGLLLRDLRPQLRGLGG